MYIYAMSRQHSLLLVSVFCGCVASTAIQAQPASKSDLEMVVGAMDRRLESIEKRLDFMQNLLMALLAFVLVSPFAVEYMARRRSERDLLALEESRKVLIALREAAQKDKNLANALRIAGLQK